MRVVCPLPGKLLKPLQRRMEAEQYSVLLELVQSKAKYYKTDAGKAAALGGKRRPATHWLHALQHGASRDGQATIVLCGGSMPHAYEKRSRLCTSCKWA